MAFDMFAGDHHECIGHHEDFLLGLVGEDRARYPQLVSLRDAFYTSPRLSPRQAGALVHELIDLLSSNGGIANKALAQNRGAPSCRSSAGHTRTSTQSCAAATDG